MLENKSSPRVEAFPLKTQIVYIGEERKFV
jgi:hypothetical protein